MSISAASGVGCPANAFWSHFAAAAASCSGVGTDGSAPGGDPLAPGADCPKVPLGMPGPGNHQDQSGRSWDLESCRELVCCQGHRNKVTTVAFSPDGHHALSGSRDWTMRLWDLESGRQLCVFRGHRGPVETVAFSADGYTALSSSSDGTTRVWHLPR